MKLTERWRRFWNSTSYVARNEIYVTHLRACAPTVSAEEIEALAQKPRVVKRTRVIDFDAELPIG